MVVVRLGGPQKEVKMEVLLPYVTYITGVAAVMSIVAAYLLSNHAVTYGRVIAFAAACTWGLYAVIAEVWALLFVDIVYCVIYVQAALKFKSKRDGYRIRFHTLEDEIEHLLSVNEGLKTKLKQIKNAYEKGIGDEE